MEKHVRSFAKAITWRISATLITILLIYSFTANLVISASVGSLEFILKMFFYYLHERIWNISNFGRENPTLKLSTHVIPLRNTPVTSPEDDDDTKPKSK